MSKVTPKNNPETSKGYLLPSDEMITDDVKMKMDLIASLIEPCDRETYGQRKQAAAKQLGVTVRSVERLLKKYREKGLMALVKTRSDRGKTRIDEDWKEFIIETYASDAKKNDEDENINSILRHQVYLKVKGKAKQLGLQKGEFPSCQTVYRILNQYIEEKRRKNNARSPGFSGEHLTHMTRDGRELLVEGSNDVWQCDHTRLNILVVDEFGTLERPWITIIIDSYSRCLMGVFLGFYAPSSQVDALTLRHAILPKSYGSEYRLKGQWNTYGVPNYFYTDGGKDFRSIHITEQVAAQLGFNCYLRRRPSDGGIVERFFRTLDDSVLRELPGYTGINVQERPKNVDKGACLTLKDLEFIIVKYIVDEYNGKPDPRTKQQTRICRWEKGCMVPPHLYNERELDIALMKMTRRTVQKFGTLQFENLTYRSELLKGRAGETVAIRYDPDDITTILVYEYLSDGTESFLDYAHAMNLEAEVLSYRELKAFNKQLKEAEENINNNTVLDAMMERQALTQELVHDRLERRKAAHETVNSRNSIKQKLSIQESDGLEATEIEEEDDISPPQYKVRYMDEFLDD
ncbi:MAG: hypothetical protein N5P05_001375 [Chroococcopsis gigantea SAG 12.99]|jgi:putative transposase|nr:DDE-type integrase/transposase/recombinase [Chlorogloea purpurea SAG 13.99]MDV2999769.1 hypothetical protein [Chroococcopsis gigantea SAG 12.99]